MRRAATIAGVVALLFLAPPGEAAITLELRVDVALRDEVTVHVGAKNLGDEVAEGALPEVTLLGTTAWGAEPAFLGTDFVAAWDVKFPRPAALGTLPIVVQLHYADLGGHRMSAPAVHVLRTAGTPDGDVGLTIEATPVVETGTATVRIENREAAPITGTLGLVASIELAMTPTERPVTIAPGTTLTVPVRIENRGAITGSAVALWAHLTLTRATYVETFTANAVVPIVPPTEERRPSAILLPLAGVALVALLLWGARRLLRPAAGPESRADRRRAGR